MWANMSQYSGISLSAEGVGHQFRRCLISVVSWGSARLLITALTGKIGVDWAYHMDHILCFSIAVIKQMCHVSPYCLISLNITCSYNLAKFLVGDNEAMTVHLIWAGIELYTGSNHLPTQCTLKHCCHLRLRPPQAIPSTL